MTIQAVVIPVVAAVVLAGISAGRMSDGSLRFDAPVLSSQDADEDLRAAATSAGGEVERFYQATSFQPVWTNNGRLTTRGEELASVLKNASVRGLDPKNYAVALDDEPAKLEVSFTVAFLSYAADVRSGRWNPEIYKVAVDAEHRTAPISQVASAIANDPNGIAAGLAKLDPPFAEYKRLETALAKYRAMSDTGLALPDVQKPVEPNAAYENAVTLAAILRAHGDLGPDTEVPADGIYAPALVQAVKRFQGRHGLEPDGRIGKTTVAELNVPFTARVRQIELAMERWRWLPHQFRSGPIVVNVPEFQLRAFDESLNLALEMRVVTGQARGHATPLFAGDMKYVVFGPYWNVPASIQSNEIVPKIRRDREYLAKHGYEIVRHSGEPVAYDELTDDLLEQLKSRKLAVRQTPGPENSLGRVKFMFPNENNVYLHDTPSRSLFARAQRDLSHGCMRVEKPQQLAEWVLRNETAWTTEKIAAALEEPVQRHANLKTSIPVLVVYLRAMAGADGQVKFFRDVYKQDAELEARIAKGKTMTVTSSERAQRPRG